MIIMQVVTVGLLLLLAFLLRVWGIHWGLPQLLQPDEAQIFIQAFKMAADLGKPDVFYFGTLLQTLIAFQFGLIFLIGKLFHTYTNSSDIIIAYFRNPTFFVVSSRGLIIFISLAHILSVYLVTKKLFSHQIAILSALLLALSPLHVKESHIVKADILAGLLVWLVFYCALRFFTAKKMSWLILGSVFAGLSFTTKYYPILCIYFLFTALFIQRWRSLIDRKIFFLRCAAVGFITAGSIFLSSPYLLPTIFHAKDQNIPILFSSTATFTGAEFSGPNFYGRTALAFGFNYFPNALSWLIICLAFYGGVIAYKKFRTELVFILGYIILFLLTIDLWLSIRIDRYAIHVLPFITTLAAIGILSLFEKIQWKWAKVLFVLALIFTPFKRSLTIDWYMSQSDIRHQAKAYVEQSIPSHSLIAVEGTFSNQHPAVWGPQFALSAQQIENQERVTDRLLTFQKQANESKAQYQQIIPFPVAGSEGQLIGSPELAQFMVKKYAERNIEVIITNSWNEHDYPFKHTHVFEDNEFYVVQKQFSPQLSLSQEFWSYPTNYSEIDTINLFEKKSVGPEITIYQLKK